MTNSYSATSLFIATVLLIVPLGGGLHAQSNTFEIRSDQKSTVSGADLCLAVDTKKQLVPDRGAMVVPQNDGKPFALTGTFYPVVVTRCDALNADQLGKWYRTDTFELRIRVGSRPMCLSWRTNEAMQPLLDPLIRAFEVTVPDAPFGYLANVLAKGRAGMNVVASECGRSDAADFWSYDDLNGTIAMPSAGRCLAIAGDNAKPPARYDAGMPVTSAGCPDILLYDRAAIVPQQRWTTTAAHEFLPAYVAPDPKEYFSGTGGLPIVGPMGRCLTVDKPSRNVVTSFCDGRVEQQWRLDKAAIRFGTGGDCLARATDGLVSLGVCKSDESQRWLYTVADPVPNPKWLGAFVYGQIHPEGSADQCLVVTDDPFIDPMRQRNRVKIASCGAVPPQQTSWFLNTKVRTIRLGLLRYMDDDGGNPSNGNPSDERIKSLAERLALRLSEHYSVLGVRFVFDPDNDYLARKDTIANQVVNRTSDGKPIWEPARRFTAIAATMLYHRATIVTMSGYHGGGSSGGYTEFEPDRIREPISRKIVPDYRTFEGLPKDAAFLPAISYNVSEHSIGLNYGTVAHHAHEFGHYFGLGHTFNQDEFGDTPDDLGGGDEWLKLGTIGCGNPRSVELNRKRYTPDRLNNEGYFGCQIGRAHNVFTPLQLGYMAWQIERQLNRYPLVACQPTASYDANHVECENQATLALCRQTADYLRKKGGTQLVCELGGQYRRAIEQALQYPAVMDLLRKTPAGQQLMNRLAGRPSNAPALTDALSYRRCAEAQGLSQSAADNCGGLALARVRGRRETEECGA